MRSGREAGTFFLGRNVVKNKYFYLISITFVVLLVDQLAKIWVRLNLNAHKTIDVIPGLFRLVHVENEGAAWGILSGSAYRIPFFIVATLIAFGVIGVYFSRIPKGQNLLVIAISLILGGALGNFIDRLYYRSVTDFLDFYISYQPISSWLIKSPLHSNRWPSFNIADAAIVVGLGLIMYDMLVLEGRRAAQESGSGEGAEASREPSSEGRSSRMQSTGVQSAGVQSTGEGGR